MQISSQEYVRKNGQKHVASGVCRSGGCNHLTGCLSTEDESVQLIEKRLKFTCIVQSEAFHSIVSKGYPFCHCPSIH